LLRKLAKLGAAILDSVSVYELILLASSLSAAFGSPGRPGFGKLGSEEAELETLACCQLPELASHFTHIFGRL